MKTAPVHAAVIFLACMIAGIQSANAQDDPWPGDPLLMEEPD